MADMKYLKLLSEEYTCRQSVFSEIINLNAILGLPCGTEHFMSDIHGEYEAFEHILNNCSGVIREKVKTIFDGELTQDAQNDLCTLIYYPDKKLDKVEDSFNGEIPFEWWKENLLNLVHVARHFADLYTQSKVRKAMPVDFAYIIDELLHGQGRASEKRERYHERIIETIVNTGSGPDFVESLSNLIKRLAVDHLHIVGDIFDRGEHADFVIDRLINHHSVDIQWGNHDILWMGAAAGSEVCQAAVVRNNIHYKTTDILESSYGISLRKLALFAEHTYRSDDKISAMEKAITIIMFKLEGQLIDRNPSFNMQCRKLLQNICEDKTHVEIDGKKISLNTSDFPTLDKKSPYELTCGEQEIVDDISSSFEASERLHYHINFMYRAGSMYLVRNNNLIFHACIPLDEDEIFYSMKIGGKLYAGKDLIDAFEKCARRAWSIHDQKDLDIMYYLWCGSRSPLSGRVMKTFERTYIDDKSYWTEEEDPYWKMITTPAIAKQLLMEFGIPAASGHIINGHTPVKASAGESPIKSGGKLIVIDGGFCMAYHKTTGIAGYTLIADTYGLRIKAHRPFTSIKDVLDLNADIMSDSDRFETYASPMLVEDTDTGSTIRSRLLDLGSLLDAYNSGDIRER